MITRMQMPRQLRNKGGITNVSSRKKYGIGSSIKDFTRKIIPNELADVAVKAAPFVAPFYPGYAALMRGIGRFDQRGSISDALKQGAATYAFGEGARRLGGLDPFTSGNPFSDKTPAGSKFSFENLRERGIGKLFKGPGESNTPGDVLNRKMPGDPEANIYKNIETKPTGFMERATAATIDKIPFADKLPQIVKEKLLVGGITSGASALYSYFTGEFEPQEPGETMGEYMARRNTRVKQQMRGYMDSYYTPLRNPQYAAMSDEEKNNFIDSIVGEQNDAMMATGGRVGYQTGGISSLNTLAQNIARNRANQAAFNQMIRPAQIRAAKITPSKITPIQPTPARITPAKITPSKITPIQPTPAKITPIQTRPINITPAQISSLKKPVDPKDAGVVSFNRSKFIDPLVYSLNMDGSSEPDYIDPGFLGGFGFVIDGKRYMSEQEAIADMGVERYNMFMAEGGRVGYQTGGISSANTLAENIARNRAAQSAFQQSIAPAQQKTRQTIASRAFPEGNFQQIRTSAPTQKDYNIKATEDLVRNLPGGIVRDALAPAAAAVLSLPYDAIQASQRMEPGSGISGFVDAFKAENPISSLKERTTGAAGPLAERLSKIDLGMSEAAAATPTPDDKIYINSEGTVTEKPRYIPGTPFNYRGDVLHLGDDPAANLSEELRKRYPKSLLKPTMADVAGPSPKLPTVDSIRKTAKAKFGGGGGGPNTPGGSIVYVGVGGTPVYKSEFGYEVVSPDGTYTSIGGGDMSLQELLDVRGLRRENDPVSIARREAAARRANVASGGMPTGIMRSNQAGVMERDYRDEGGFVPVGIKEKADDVPAMLSKNEFVFTADAVRGAGNGSIEKGAQKMYDTMKNLERRVV